MPQPQASAFRRTDESPDAEFYRVPRLVTHIDDAAIAAVTQLYRELLPPGGRVLDLMSSWVSHLPPEIDYAAVAGLGMNGVELSKNPRLTNRVVHDLNADPILPFDDESFDAAVCCVSIDYLTRPIEVVREVGRVLTAGGPFVVTFSNRCFPTKAVAAWHQTGDAGHVELVESYFAEASNLAEVEHFDRSPPRKLLGRDPLYAVVGRRA